APIQGPPPQEPNTRFRRDASYTRSRKAPPLLEFGFRLGFLGSSCLSPPRGKRFRRRPQRRPCPDPRLPVQTSLGKTNRHDPFHRHGAMHSMTLQSDLEARYPVPASSKTVG